MPSSYSIAALEPDDDPEPILQPLSSIQIPFNRIDSGVSGVN